MPVRWWGPDVLSVRTAIVDRLKGDPVFYPGLAVGGVYERPLKAGKGEGSTPAAFWVDPGDPAKVIRLREAVVVADGGEVLPSDGPIAVADLRLWQTFPRLFVYVPATSTGKVALDAIDDRARWLLAGWQAQLAHGYALSLDVLERTAAIESDEFPGSLVCYRRYRGEYLRSA